MRVRKASLLAVVAAAAALVLVSGTADAAVGPVQDPPFAVTSNVPSAPLAGVSAISTSDVWAVGDDDGAMLAENWTGGQWSSVAMPAVSGTNADTNLRLTGVSGDSASDVIAVGNELLGTTPSAGPLAFKWNGGSWQQLTTPSGAWWSSMAHVQVFSPTNAWAIGETSTSTGYTATASQWNGTSWTQTQVTTPFSANLVLSMNAISGSSPTDIWAAGTVESSGWRDRVVQSVLLHYNGVSWSQVTVPDNSGLTAVAAISSTDAWAVAADGNILQLNDGTWSVATTAFSSSTVLSPAIAAVSATNIWIAGVVADDEFAVVHYNGASWTSQAEPTGFTATGGSALPSGQAWFSGSVLESNGATVIPAVLPVS
jgi:hypothetical protein